MSTITAVVIHGWEDRGAIELPEVGLIELGELGFPGAVLARQGDEIFLEYANLTAIAEYHDRGQGEPPAEARITGTLKWERDGARGGEPLVLRAQMGCRGYTRVPGKGWELRPQEGWDEFADFVLDGMTAEALVPGWQLDAVTSATAPLDSDPDSSGSEWVSAYGCPQVSAMCLMARQGAGISSEQASAAHTEAHRRAGRAVWWRVWDDVLQGPRGLQGRQDEWLMHRGYRNGTAGGWKRQGKTGLYGSPIPPGVPEQTGATPGHATHGELELAIGLAVMTGSAHLAEATMQTWQNWLRLIVAHDFHSSRALGRMLRTASLLSFLPGVDMEQLAEDVTFVLAYQEGRESGGMPSPDWEGVSSYHLNLSQIDELLRDLGINPDSIDEKTRRSWGDSDCCWMVAQLGHGGRSVRRSPLAGHLSGWALGRLDHLKGVCEAFIARLATGLSLNQGTARFEFPPGNGTYEDVATKGPVRITKGGGGHGDAVGVLGRFWVPEVYSMARERPGHRDELLSLAEGVLAACDESENWGSRGDDLLMSTLESQWPVVRERGLPAG
jgi:hypothetical protein